MSTIIERGRQLEVDTQLDKLEMVEAVLLIDRWVLAAHMTASIELG